MRRERCSQCGARFEVKRPGGRGRSPTAVLAWTAILLLVAWGLLRSFDYSTVRVSVYAGVARGVEAFLHPAWAAILVLLAVCLFLVSRRRATPPAVAAAVAPAVQLRAEPPGMISVVVEGSRDAVAGDRVVERDLAAEERVVEAFHALARRTAAFTGIGGGGGWSGAQIEDARREIYALGVTIGNELLGGSSRVADCLIDLPGDHLQLGVQRELSGIPWELMVARRGGDHLWQLFSVTRQLRDVAGVRPAPPRSSRPCRLLLLANLEAGVPGRDLPAAEREAADILELGATRPDLMRVVRKSPRSFAELRGLVEEGFDVIHFAGHTGSSEGLERGWVLANGVPVSPGELFAGGAPAPTLVFANACSSNPRGGGENVADAARALMLAGVPAYMCTLAELHDSGSAAFSSSFYRAVLKGATLGRAITAARTALLGRHPVTWANYVLYGDPALSLCGAPDTNIPAKNPGLGSD
ncbi:MAG: CHAT domain-containing protein [Candidatus Eisenbacteria bacterium]